MQHDPCIVIHALFCLITSLLHVEQTARDLAMKIGDISGDGKKEIVGQKIVNKSKLTYSREYL